VELQAKISKRRSSRGLRIELSLIIEEVVMEIVQRKGRSIGHE
jgi:hypothetical protein